MRHILALSAILLAAWAGPAAAGHKHKPDRGYANPPSGEAQARKHKRERAKAWKRSRHGKYYYAYPSTPWWGPFPGPPGLW